MSDLLYRKELLRLAADAHGAGRLPDPDATAMVHNPACGDRITVDLALAGDRIIHIVHETKACVLTQASASILGQHLRNVDKNTVAGLRADIVGMLESGGPPPADPFAGYAVFDAATAFPGRHRCVLLPLDAVLEALADLAPPEPESIGRKEV
jgi:NifU-like protein involved in Fe-S cluster formation